MDDPGGTPVTKKSTLANIVGYVVTTAGDIIYATASRTLARLGTGTAGQSLRVNSGATAPFWGDNGYVLNDHAPSWNPADATTYFFGSSDRTINSTAVARKVVVPLAGTVIAAYVIFDQVGTTGTTETSTLSFRLNNSSDTTISAVVPTNTVKAAWREIDASDQGMEPGDAVTFIFATGGTRGTTDALNVYEIEVTYRSDLVYNEGDER